MLTMTTMTFVMDLFTLVWRFILPSERRKWVRKTVPLAVILLTICHVQMDLEKHFLNFGRFHITISTLAKLSTLALRIVDTCVTIRGFLSIANVVSTLRNIDSIRDELRNLLVDLRNRRINQDLLEENNFVDFGGWNIIREVVWWTVYLIWIGFVDGSMRSEVVMSWSRRLGFTRYPTSESTQNTSEASRSVPSAVSKFGQL